MKRVAIIDYGMCNLDSVARAIIECGGEPSIVTRATMLSVATHIVLPGVGAFRDAMVNIRQQGLVEALREHVIANKTPFLGICLGMQILGTLSWEGGETAGLGWIDGEVRRLERTGDDIRIPHIGWNEVNFESHAPLFHGIESGKDFYFDHSFKLCCSDTCDILAVTPYCGGFVSVVGKDNILGVQFHPEKSQRVGLQLLKNFIAH